MEKIELGNAKGGRIRLLEPAGDVRSSTLNLLSQMQASLENALVGFQAVEIRTVIKRYSGACYIATCIYGSYDCPQVWVLRRFRDGRLSASLVGRGFIRSYYALCPGFVKRFGASRWCRRVARKWLDILVQRLKAAGYTDTIYCDEDIAVRRKLAC
jgi:hypothetical protein